MLRAVETAYKEKKTNMKVKCCILNVRKIKI